MKNIKTWQDVLLEITETDPADFSDRSNICISPKDLGDILKAAMDGPETLQSQQDREIGKKWREDSRLEEWFPFTHDEHLRLQVEVARLRSVASCQVDFHTESAAHENTNSTP